MEQRNVIFHPIISTIQKIALYETKAKYYLVGSNNTQTRFRVLKIDRMESSNLAIYDDKVEYTKDEICDLLNMIDSGNRQRSSNSFARGIYAFGIVGFIKFLEGYYIILITKRTRVAVIGHHAIYKIEDTTMIYIPHESVRLIHPEEQRYLKMFQNVDLSSNFYFSYSYELSHTLQYNLANPKRIIPTTTNEELAYSLPTFGNNTMESQSSEIKDTNCVQNYGVRLKPNRKFIWNTFLLKEVENDLHPDWLLYIMHGFVSQSNMNIYGRSIYMTLIARRSCKYAGTRFLKRGANFQGDVANEVETEQIVHDSGISDLSRCRVTSFVQMRGSIPGHWKQDMGKMVAKPAITIELNQPYAETAALHFNELLKRYGSPIVILNLVKQRERKKQEKLLSDELSGAVRYLNQFLPPEYSIVYKTFDMARKNKSSSNVMKALEGIARSAVMRTGIFYNQKQYHSQKTSTIIGSQKNFINDRSFQTGIIRTNCVDCLDRTNTAQFAIGKCVLGYQLCALGVLDSPTLEFDTDCVRMLESLYEDHGDTLALQYGGSQLVHRVKTYRKTAPWSSQGNDIMQTFSRYYSNTFSDAEKQNAMNLFLGLFVPDEQGPQLWEFTNDYYFHHKPVLDLERSLTLWYDEELLKCLPYSYNLLMKACSEIIQLQVDTLDVEMIDAYSDYHRPFEFSVLGDLYAYKMPNSVRDFMPNCTVNCSPFSVRVRPMKKKEESSKAGTMKNPSVTGQSSVSSTASSSCSGEESSTEEASINTESQMTESKGSTVEKFVFQSLFPSMKQVYGIELVAPKRADQLLYKKYVLMGKKASGTVRHNLTPNFLNPIQQNVVSKNTCREIEPPKVKPESIEIYKQYILKAKNGGFMPKAKDLAIYQKYASFK